MSQSDDEIRAAIRKNREQITFLFAENKRLRRRLVDRKRDRLDYTMERRKKIQNKTLVKSEEARWNRWENADELFLLQNADTMTQEQLAGALGRTFFAINSRLKKLRKDEKEMEQLPR